MKQKRHFRGAASLFMVVFTALLLSVLVLSFIKIMVKDQDRASRSDLSQSAYDSAMAGVEDAKRAVAKYVSSCVMSTSSDCDKMRQALDGASCDAINTIIHNTTPGESIIGTTEDEKNLDQAYTCVKIQYQTPDYLGVFGSLNDAVIIPINGTEDVQHIVVSWFTTDDFSGVENKNLNLINYQASQGQWTKDADWPSNRPPIIIAQYFRFSDNLANYDRGGSNFKTVFLVPSSTGLNQGQFSKDGRIGYNPPISPVRCAPNLNAGGYACEYTMELPEEAQASQPDRTFIRLSKRYSSKATFKVRLKDKHGNFVKFDGVQPAVDSNGRANDLFRRVEARIQPLTGGSGAIPTPLGAVRIEKGDFCKDFSVSDTKVESWGCS